MPGHRLLTFLAIAVLGVAALAAPAAAECVSATVTVTRPSTAPYNVLGPNQCVLTTPWPQVIEVPVYLSDEGYVVYLRLLVPLP